MLPAPPSSPFDAGVYDRALALRVAPLVATHGGGLIAAGSGRPASFAPSLPAFPVVGLESCVEVAVAGVEPGLTHTFLERPPLPPPLPPPYPPYIAELRSPRGPEPRVCHTRSVRCVLAGWEPVGK